MDNDDEDYERMPANGQTKRKMTSKIDIIDYVVIIIIIIILMVNNY